MPKIFYFLIILTALLTSCGKNEDLNPSFELIKAFVGSTPLILDGTTENVPPDQAIIVEFSAPLDESSVSGAVTLSSAEGNKAVDVQVSSRKNLLIRPVGLLKSNTTYTVTISNLLKSADGDKFSPFAFSFKTKLAALQLLSVKIDGANIGQATRVQNVNTDLSLVLSFSEAVQPESLKNALSLTSNPSLSFSSVDDKTIEINSNAPLEFLRKYTLQISNSFKGVNEEPFSGYSLTLYTPLDSTFKFPEISDEALLTKIQEQTFKYFWDFAHPSSGLIRERNTSGDLVTSGGSGFGLMAILVGIERGFISRTQGIERLDKIITFLGDKADRFHGVWSHWLNGISGDVIPFSADDNGGDLVETAFLVQGLLTVRQYLDNNNPQEQNIRDKINTLWQEVEWDWHTRGGQDVLFWHWSPNFGWQKNQRISGWNEALIVYVLAAGSNTHTIDPDVYHQGWARSGDMQNGNAYYNTVLPLGGDRGGPLFFSHYSFLGLDPRNLEDQYANYWTQNIAHTQINYAYCQANPANFVGYSEACWGLTASDNHQGYSAHSPTNDLGVITPTAAISSIPYTPEESMRAIRHFYYLLGDKLWGEYGFYDAFNITEQWYADSYLAIDQGPIIVMIENHRTGLLWDLFMSAPEIQSGLTKLGFIY